MHFLIALLHGQWEPGWFISLVAGSQLLALLTLPSVLLRRQGRPRAALSWLLAMFALPALGVIAWWAFGRTHIARRRRKRFEAARAFAKRYGQAHTELGTPFDRILPADAVGDSIFMSNGNQVELLFDGPNAYPAMERAIAQAKRSVHLLFYIFHDDETGRRLRDLLAEKARGGVTVRVLVDAWGTPHFAGKFSDPLRAAGAKVAAFLPTRLLPLLAPRLNFSNHRKLIVVDEEIGFLGGMNVGNEYAREWRDVMVRLRGPSVRALAHIFLDDWYFATNEDLGHDVLEVEERPGDVPCAVVVSGPDRESFIHDAYFILFTRAERRLWIVTPYFIPGDAIATAIRTAASRGVDVRVVLPRSSDVVVAKLAARSFYPEFVASGVRIYEYLGGMLHAKVWVVDDDTSAVGSANLDARSFGLSFEIGCLIRDRGASDRITAWCETLFAASHEITLEECLRRSTGEKLLQSAAHLFSPVL
jgi:cardiolipin synthase